MTERLSQLPATCVAAVMILCGCSSERTSPPDSTTEAASSSESPAESDALLPSQPVVLGDMVEPFDPPSLSELETGNVWVDRPVLDSMQLMREHQSGWGPPELTATEALALRNDSPEINEQILRTLGRLAPETGAGVDYDAKWMRQTGADLKSTNPLLASSVTEFDYGSYSNLSSLFGFDRDFNMFAAADLVQSWQTSEDRLLDKVVMRDDLTWSDGTPVTAHDVAFSFRAIMTESVIVPAVRQGTDELRWVEAYDDQTVVFFHKESLATNQWNIYFPVMPKHVYETTIPADPTMARSEAHSRLEDQPVVAGPYTLEKRVRGQEFVLKRRESYYMHNGRQVRRKPYFAEVRFKIIEDPNTALLALKAAEIDEQTLNAEQWQSQTSGDDFYNRNTKVTALEWTSFHFAWNLETPYFSDKRVRQAMSYAMDYDEMLYTILYGLYQPNRGPFHPTSWMFPEDGPQPYRQNLDKAEELLDAAGWTDSDEDGYRDKSIGGQTVPFRFTLLCGTTPNSIKVSTLFKESLDTIGILCIVKPTEFTVLQQSMRDHKFQGAFGGWGTGADPDTTSNIFETDAGRNYGNYANPRVDELFEQAKREFDRDKRGALYGEIHNLLWEDQPYTWLFYRNSFYGFSKKLRGYNFSPRGPYSFGPGADSIFMPSASP